MTIQSSQERRMRILEWKSQLQQNPRLRFLQTTPIKETARATEGERNLVLTGFVLGTLSVITGFFPIAGLPIALAGLVMGLASRRVVALHHIASWSIWLSLTGLVVALVNIIVTITLYFSVYLFR